MVQYGNSESSAVLQTPKDKNYLFLHCVSRILNQMKIANLTYHCDSL